MAAIRALRSNVTLEQARAVLDGGGPAGWLRRLRRGRLRSFAEVYVPYRIYEVECRDAGRTTVGYFGLDAVAGQLDLYYFERPLTESDVVEVSTRNRPAAALDEAQARVLLLDKIRRQLFRRGAFRLRHPQFRVRRIGGEVHVPYWVGFYGSRQEARLAVMDAVRRTREGGKLCELIYSWLVA